MCSSKCALSIGAAALMLSAAWSSGCRSQAAPGGAPAAAPLPAVPVLTAAHGTIESAIEISGNLAPETRVDIRPKFTGRLETVDVRMGDRVTAGAVLATMDRRELDAQAEAAAAAVSVARASVEAADAALQHATQELDRARTLFEKGGVARQRLDAAETQRRAAKAQRDLSAANVEQTEAALRRARDVQRDASLHAPVAGVIVARNFDPGSIAGPAGDKPVLALANLRTLKLDAGVSELDAGRLKVGAPVTVTLSARPGETFTGRLTALAPEVDPQNRHFRVEIRVDNPSDTLLGGMYATARIIVGTATGVIVPREAVADRQGARVVYRVEGDTVRSVKVTEGLADATRVALSAGINAGDVVVSDARRDVVDGAKVRPIKAN